eukprot:CAMPEP_0197019510 /NCGR_PEP_ID=MMETSP1380-20130617/80747_1 /TAXON_ID=5936 /ORGANISM="Euplotes crassus, Strain CT5" /LENGTH=256 /DNA_ID=CAMNT_0042446945 /DNA_START=36 /DNA_END=803 /DNA_ORIENTATION=-
MEDPEFIEEIDYWHTCITKIRERISKMKLDNLYLHFVTQNSAKIEEAFKKAQEEKERITKEQQSLASSMNTEKAKEYIEKLQKELEALKKAQDSHNMQVPTAASIDHKTPANVRFDLNDTFSYNNMDSASIPQLKEEEDKDYEEDENEFTEDVIFFKGMEYSWSGKYKPRKPRFFNRVKTGYEWNAYNKAHFTMDDPPPKIVQGYKFNIFYPDLINKQETPQYFLENCEDPAKIRIIFRAGPPYEDIAFEIVNKEW